MKFGDMAEIVDGDCCKSVLSERLGPLNLVLDKMIPYLLSKGLLGL